MSRTVVVIKTDHAPQKIDEIIAAFFRDRGFREVDYKGEAAMKKGGLITVPMYIKAVVSDGEVRLEGWVRSFGEHGLSGRVGLLPKYMLQKAMSGLIGSISPLEPVKKDA